MRLLLPAPPSSAQVWAYTNADSVELFLDDVSQGRQVVPHADRAEWLVAYRPGALSARGYDAIGRVVSRATLSSPGAPSRVRATVEFPEGRDLAADARDVALLRIAVVDAAGRVVPSADARVRVTVRGPGRLIGIGNGDPADQDADKGRERRVFRGLCRCVVQTTREAGLICVAVSAPGLGTGEVCLRSRRPEPGPGPGPGDEGQEQRALACDEEGLVGRVQAWGVLAVTVGVCVAAVCGMRGRRGSVASGREMLRRFGPGWSGRWI